MHNTNQQAMPNTDWARGYFCAVATLIRMDDVANTHAKELFAAGGSPDPADEEDKCTFREYKLMRVETPPEDRSRTRIEQFEAPSQDVWP